MAGESGSGLSGPRVDARSGTADSLVVLCHGYGSNGEDLIQLAPHWQAILPNTVFVSPNAPERCPGAPNGYQWFPLSTLSKEERAVGTLAAAPALDAFIDEQLAEHGLGDDRLALVGFSQGTMMSLHVGLRRQHSLAGILGFSGALSGPERLCDEVRSRPPVMLIHGDRDEVIPFPAMFEAVGALEAAGLTVEKHISSGVAHSIGPDGLQKGGIFLARAFG